VKVEELLDLLACPKCHHALRAQSGEAQAGLVCEECQLFYALEDGLPNMLISEARAWPLSTSPAA
jgi:uncharacterized protein YbaR (Trm112 family)